MAPPPAFDAAHWLAEFKSVGGYCWFPSLDDMHVCWQIDGRPDADQYKARALYNFVELDDDREPRWQAIEALVMAEILEAATLH